MNLFSPSAAHRANAFYMEKGVPTFPQLLSIPPSVHVTQCPLYISVTPCLQRITSRSFIKACKALHDLWPSNFPSLPWTVKTTQTSFLKKAKLLDLSLVSGNLYLGFSLSRAPFPQIVTWLTPSIHLDLTWKSSPSKLTSLLVLSENQPHL